MTLRNFHAKRDRCVITWCQMSLSMSTLCIYRGSSMLIDLLERGDGLPDALVSNPGRRQIFHRADQWAELIWFINLFMYILLVFIIVWILCGTFKIAFLIIIIIILKYLYIIYNIIKLFIIIKKKIILNTEIVFSFVF